MSFTNDWAVTDNPADHTKFKDQPSFVRKLRTDLEERLAALLYGFTTGDVLTGFKQAILNSQSTDPSAPTDAIVAFGKDVYVFTVSGMTVYPLFGATYTNNSKTFTVQGSSGTKIYATGTGAPESSGTLTKTAGTGDDTVTFSAVATVVSELAVRHESAGIKVLTTLGSVLGAFLTALDSLRSDAGVIPGANLGSGSVEFIIGNGIDAITAGVKGDIRFPYPVTLTGWYLLADQSGAIKVDLWKDTLANFPPVDGDSITNGHEPEIAASGTNASDTDIADWTGEDSVAAGDIIRVNVDSATTITRCALVLMFTRK